MALVPLPADAQLDDGQQTGGLVSLPNNVPLDGSSEYDTNMAAERTKLAAARDKINAGNLPEWSKRNALSRIDAHDQRAQMPEAPRWDPLGDIGRSARSSLDTMAEGFKGLNPFSSEHTAQMKEDQQGGLLGQIKGEGRDLLNIGKSAAAIPMGAMGLLGSPVTGLLHAGPGSALSYIPGVDKRTADATVDTAMMGIAPAGLELGPIAAGKNFRFNQDYNNATRQNEIVNSNAAAKAKNPVLANAREQGYVISPTDVPGGEHTASGQFASLGGKIKTQQAASIKNQEVTNALAAKELGLPVDATLDEATFKGVRAQQANAYKAIENSAASLPTGRVVADQQYLSDVAGLDSKSAEFAADFPEAAAQRSEAVKKVQDVILKQDFSPKAGVEMIRNLRDDARANLKNWTDTDKVRLGAAQRDAANAIEDLIERQLTTHGSPEMVNAYRSARQLIAKSHDIEAATDAAGNVNARKLATLSQRRPFTGGLKTIADTAEVFPKSMQAPTRIGASEGHSVLDRLMAVAGLATGHPVLAAAAMSRPLARSRALSEVHQNGLLGLRKESSLMPNLQQSAAPLLYGDAARRSLLPPD